jgi:glycosyltransferase involved in cell wall biosynthesis
MIGVVVEQLCRQPSGGIGVYARSLCRALSQLESVDVISVSSRHNKPTTPNPAFLMTPHRLTNELMSRGMRVPGWKAATQSAELIHATSFDLPRRGARPQTVFVHDLLWRRWPGAYSKRGIAWHERALHRALADGNDLLVPSNAVRQDLLPAGANPANITVIGEGSDHLPEPSEPIVDLDSRMYLLSVATSQPRKNLPGLLRAYERYRSTVASPLDLVIVGPNGWGPQLPAATAGVELRGSVSDLQLSNLYANAAAVVFVPFEEGFGLPVVEAWRAGAPIVASLGVPIAAEHPDAALLIDPLDIDSIAEALRVVTTDLSSAQEFAARGQLLARQMTWRHVAQEHVSIWNKLLDR